MIALPLLQVSIAAGLLAFTPARPPSLFAIGPSTEIPWQDPSPHRVRRVAVARAVELEVLDWGGSGAPLVFLAGGGNTAHVFDHFATRFTNRFHVLGITRRGFGASSRPAAGYDTTTLVRDIVTVLDSLGISKASFAAHSFGASELNALAARYPGRVNRLVYLDSAFDVRAILDSPEWKSGVLPSPQPPTPAYDDNSAASWTLWAERMSGPDHPEAEVRAMYQFDADGRFIGSATADSALEVLLRGTEAADFQRIRAPVLALYAAPGSAQVMYPYWQALDPTSQARGQKAFAALAGLHARLRTQFRDEVEHVRVVTIPGARHYIFLTHPAEVTHAMLEFLLST